MQLKESLVRRRVIGAVFKRHTIFRVCKVWKVMIRFYVTKWSCCNFTGASSSVGDALHGHRLIQCSVLHDTNVAPTAPHLHISRKCARSASRVGLPYVSRTDPARFRAARDGRTRVFPARELLCGRYYY